MRACAPVLLERGLHEIQVFGKYIVKPAEERAARHLCVTHTLAGLDTRHWPPQNAASTLGSLIARPGAPRSRNPARSYRVCNDTSTVATYLEAPYPSALCDR